MWRLCCRASVFLPWPLPPWPLWREVRERAGRHGTPWRARHRCAGAGGRCTRYQTMVIGNLNSSAYCAIMATIKPTMSCYLGRFFEHLKNNGAKKHASYSHYMMYMLPIRAYNMPWDIIIYILYIYVNAFIFSKGKNTEHPWMKEFDPRTLQIISAPNWLTKLTFFAGALGTWCSSRVWNPGSSHHDSLYIRLDVILGWSVATSMSRDELRIQLDHFKRHSFGRKHPRNWVNHESTLFFAEYINTPLFLDYTSKRHESTIPFLYKPHQYQVFSGFSCWSGHRLPLEILRSAPSEMLKLNSCNCDLILDTVAWAANPLDRWSCACGTRFVLMCLTTCLLFLLLIFRCQRQFSFNKSVGKHTKSPTYTRLTVLVLFFFGF